MSRAMSKKHALACFVVISLVLGGCKGSSGPKAGSDGGPAAAGGAAAPLVTAKVNTPPPPPPDQWKPLLGLLPADPMVLFFAGDGAGLLRSARQALNKLRGTSVGMVLEELVRMTQHKMGLADIDAFDPAAWQARGFEPARGVALVQTDPEHGFMLIGANDPAKVEPFIQNFLRKSEEAASFKKVGEFTMALLASGKPAYAYQFHQGYCIMAGPVTSEVDAAALLAKVTKPDAKRFVASPSFSLVADKWDFGKGLHALFFPSLAATFPPDTKAFFSGFKGLAAQIEVSEQGATAQFYLPTSAQTSAALRGLGAAGTSQPGLVRSLGDDTLLALGARVNQWALLNLVIGLSPPVKAVVDAALNRLKTKMDIDVEKELFQNLTGDTALGIHKLDASVFPMLLGGTSLGDLLQADPFHVTVLLRVRDAVVASKFLRKLGALADTSTEKVGAIEVFPLPFARLVGGPAKKGGPAIRAALSGDTLVLTVGKGRMEKALAAVAAKDGPFGAKILDADTRAKLVDNPGHPVGYLLGTTFHENLKDLEGALLKKGSLLLSSIVQKLTELVEKVADLSFGGEAQPTGVRGWLRLRLK